MTDSELLTLMAREAQRLADENDHSAASLMNAAADRLRSVDEQAQREIRRLRLEEGDLVVVTTKDRLTAEAAERIQRMVGEFVRHSVAEGRTLVLDGSLGMQVVSKAEVEQARGAT